MKVARIYLRVSTIQQDLHRQESIEEATRTAGYYIAGVYREKASGARADRPIDAALKQLKSEGYPVLDEDVARISPLIFHHINMLGRYLFSVPDEVAKGKLRPLRNPSKEAMSA